jgi:hypothetical protein
VVAHDKLRWYVLGQGMGAYRGEVLKRAAGGGRGSAGILFLE